MSSGDIFYDKIHFRHDPKWSGRLGPAEGGGQLLCVACVIEMIESEDISVRKMNQTNTNHFIALFTIPLLSLLPFLLQSARKSFALIGILQVLRCSPGALRELLRQDSSVSLRFTASLLGEKQWARN